MSGSRSTHELKPRLAQLVDQVMEHVTELLRKLGIDDLRCSIDDLRKKITEALEFYASFHQNITNQEIHTVCIPLIVWTVLVWLSAIPLPLMGNVSNLLVPLYSLGYGVYDFKLGLASGVIFSLLSYTAGLFQEGVSNSNTLALGLHVLSWIAQIYGHIEFEHNSPAFLTSLGQSFVIAPLFSVKEMLGFFIEFFKRCIDACKSFVVDCAEACQSFFGINEIRSFFSGFSLFNQNQNQQPLSVVIEEVDGDENLDLKKSLGKN